MVHTFDPQNMSRLDSPERKKYLPAEELLREMGLASGSVFLDIGAGTGFFSFPALKIVGPNGRVIAVDSSSEMCSELSRRSREAEAAISVVLSTGTDFHVAPGTADFAFLGSILHEVESKEEFLIEVGKALKPRGKIGIIEWGTEDLSHGPSAAVRIKSTDLIHILESSGFSEPFAKKFNDRYYYATARKRGE